MAACVRVEELGNGGKAVSLIGVHSDGLLAGVPMADVLADGSARIAFPSSGMFTAEQVAAFKAFFEAV